MTENRDNWPSGHRKPRTSGHRMPAENILFPRPCYEGMISTSLEVIWEISVQTPLRAVLLHFRDIRPQPRRKPRVQHRGVLALHPPSVFRMARGIAPGCGNPLRRIGSPNVGKPVEHEERGHLAQAFLEPFVPVFPDAVEVGQDMTQLVCELVNVLRPIVSPGGQADLIRPVVEQRSRWLGERLHIVQTAPSRSATRSRLRWGREPGARIPAGWRIRKPTEVPARVDAQA